MILHSKNPNPFAEIIRRAFNKIGRTRIQAGDKLVPVMMLDNSIIYMRVTTKADTYAVLDHNGEIYGVVFE